MQLDHIVERIDEAFGEELPFSEAPIEPGDREALERVFGNAGYYRYLQDQVNRQIIRDYLTNAVVLGHLSEQALEPISRQISTLEGRASLSLHMLMTSVEEAGDLPTAVGREKLTPLKPPQPRPKSKSKSYIRLVHSKT